MPQPFIIEEHVRWSDVDAAGIIFYGAYVRFVELAEMELFRAAGMPYGEVFQRYDCMLPRAQVHTEFTWPARLDDRLRVAAYFTRIGQSSLTLQYDVVHLPTGHLAAHGHLVLVCTHRETMRSQPLPAELVERLAPFTLTVEEARAGLGIVDVAR